MRGHFRTFDTNRFVGETGYFFAVNFGLLELEDNGAARFGIADAKFLGHCHAVPMIGRFGHERVALEREVSGEENFHVSPSVWIC